MLLKCRPMALKTLTAPSKWAINVARWQKWSARASGLQCWGRGVSRCWAELPGEGWRHWCSWAGIGSFIPLGLQPHGGSRKCRLYENDITTSSPHSWVLEAADTHLSLYLSVSDLPHSPGPQAGRFPLILCLMGSPSLACEVGPSHTMGRPTKNLLTLCE